ncbi:MAG: cysteine synthase A [Deltaproteobacteria bacterium]|jgi:cysteine synthase A|nr:cysteine synthase A [Deltaproteobacteria bacterium]
MQIAHSAATLIGDTPMVRLDNFVRRHEVSAEIFMKLEYFNPASSVKDRIAKAMVEDAEKKGLITPHSNPPHTLIEATSGNTGVGLAFMAATRGYRLILTMPENMSDERKKLLAGMGAELALTPAGEGMGGANREAEEIAKRTPFSFMPRQFSNPANPHAHYKSTGPEIWQQCGGQVDAFVSGIGTGGTISGVGRYLKERSKTVKIYGVEPDESPLLSGGQAATHLIQGIGANFVPETLNRSIVDAYLRVPGEAAIETARELIAKEGLLCGISSGANAYAALLLAQKPEFRNRRIVCIACDTAERYISTGLFAR